jgi:hypothetical protein
MNGVSSINISYILEDWGLAVGRGEIFLFTTAFGPALRPTEYPIIDVKK